MSQASSNDDSQSIKPEVVPLDPFWLNRWQSLDDLINSAVQEIPAKGEFSHFRSILKALQSFGRNHFFYFFLGLGGKMEEGKNPLLKANKECCFARQKWFNDFSSDITKSPLEVNPEHPPNYVLRMIIDQISMDFESIQRACYQRMYGSDRQKSTLLLADKWGTEILDRFVMKENDKRGLEDNALVITYFDHATKINICPYTNIALIGIPFTATAKDDYRDLLLLPHELGHYVYHMAKMGNQSLKQYIESKLEETPSSSEEALKLVLSWSEELFCDVFGLFTSREPGVVATALSMVADNHPHHAFLDDGTYPIDALRLWIYIKTIEHIQTKLNEASTISFILSHGYLKLIPSSLSSLIKEPTSSEHEVIHEVLIKLIIQIVAELLEFSSIHSWHSIGVGQFRRELEAITIEINSSELKDSIKEFSGENDSSDSDPKPEAVQLNIDTLYKAFSLRTEKKRMEIKRMEKNRVKVSLAVENYTDLHNSKKEGLTNFPIKIGDWKPLLEANGWGVRGPEGRPTGD